jgi:hypothetical protein
MYNDISSYRTEQLQTAADQRRMANAAKAHAMHRRAPSFRGALGNGLIALGSTLTVPPTVDGFDYDKAA